ncbi:MAG: ROK family protein [Rhodobacteraceae bacterium]|nr:ROK family protein [Paracoccaceae bacterium]
MVGLLEKDKWIKKTGRTKGHIGRTAVNYEIRPDAVYIASVDLGGTKVRVYISDLGCNIMGEKSEPTDPKGHLNIIRQISRLCKETALTHRIDIRKLALAVVGVPGVPGRKPEEF